MTSPCQNPNGKVSFLKVLILFRHTHENHTIGVEMAGRGKNKVYSCSVEVAIGVIGGKWKSVILYHLIEKRVIRFGELRRLLAKATAQMLTAQLRELEADGVVHRKVYPQVPPKVEYSLTPFGESLAPIIRAMAKWGESYASESGKRISLIPK
jgi:DNA-binding HxlR family transcriptional regulator